MTIESNEADRQQEFSAAENAYFQSGGDEETFDAAVRETLEQGSNPSGPATMAEPRSEARTFVPHQALHAEREAHKKTRAELQQLRQQQAVQQERWQQMQQGGVTAAGPAEGGAQPQAPDPREDIIAYMQWQAGQNELLGAQLQQEVQIRQAQQAAEQQERLIWDVWQGSVSQAQASLPDFDRAAEFLAQHRDRQLQAMAAIHPHFADQNARNAQINAELRDIIVQIGQTGGDPATVIYQLARGFGFGHAAEAAVGRLSTAQSAARTIAGGNGQPADDPLSAEAIAHMPAAEFEAWLRQPANERRFNRLMAAS